MAHHVTDRIVVGLQRSAALLAGLAALVVIGGIGWTTTADALQTAAIIAVLAFGLPAVALYALSYWLDGEAASLEGKQLRASAASRDEAARHPFREPAFGYLIAVFAALAAWGVRALIDPVLPGSIPFITYFVAVAVSGWIGGYGPAVLATAVSACIARYFYMTPLFSFQLMTPTDAVRLGSFVFVCLAIGGLTAALHAALRRVQALANELQALQAGQMETAPDMAQSADTSQPVDLAIDEVIPPLSSE
jgi:K+-sensing histidine kinase KdpD